MKIIYAAMLAFMSLVPAAAQQKYSPFQVGLKSGQPVSQTCVDAAHAMAPIIRQFPHPDAWQWVLACDSRSWSELIQHLGYDGPKPLALTDQKNHVTYVNAEAIVHPEIGDAASPEHVISHELAHIFLHSADERKVDDQASEWINTSKVASK